MIKKRLEQFKESGEVVIFIVDEGDKSPYSNKGVVLDFDEDFIEFKTFTNTILIKLKNIVKIKSKREDGLW